MDKGLLVGTTFTLDLHHGEGRNDTRTMSSKVKIAITNSLLRCQASLEMMTSGKSHASFRINLFKSFNSRTVGILATEVLDNSFPRISRLFINSL